LIVPARVFASGFAPLISDARDLPRSLSHFDARSRPFNQAIDDIAHAERG